MLFASEVLCLRQLSGDLPRPWLEVGVGTGRFAEALGMDIGVDPAFGVLQYAKRRGVQALRALGQALPFENREFGAVFVIVTLCFADDAEGLLREAARVTRVEGGIVLGIVPAGSPWGKFYAARARAGHMFYSEARFFTLEEVRNLARVVELRFDRSVSTLFGSPDDGPFEIERPREGEDRRAGFVAMLFRPRPQPAGNTTGYDQCCNNTPATSGGKATGKINTALSAEYVGRSAAGAGMNVSWPVGKKVFTTTHLSPIRSNTIGLMKKNRAKNADFLSLLRNLG